MNNNENFFCFQVEVETEGWIAIALTFRGNIVGSDIIIGWVSDSGTATLIVRTRSHAKEILDSQDFDF